MILIRNLIILLAAVATSSILLVTFLINPIGQTSQQQYVSAQENTIVSSYNKTSTNTSFSLRFIIILLRPQVQSTHGL
jgi:hypothetical protein